MKLQYNYHSTFFLWFVLFNSHFNNFLVKDFYDVDFSWCTINRLKSTEYILCLFSNQTLSNHKSKADVFVTLRASIILWYFLYISLKTPDSFKHDLQWFHEKFLRSLVQRYMMNSEIPFIISFPDSWPWISLSSLITFNSNILLEIDGRGKAKVIHLHCLPYCFSLKIQYIHSAII